MDRLIIFLGISGEMKPLRVSPVIDSEEMLIVRVSGLLGNEELFRQKHRVSDVQEWLVEARQHLEERFPSCLKRTNADLLEDVENFYKNSSDEYFDECADSLFEYRLRHDLRFAFRGCNVPSVLFEKDEGGVVVHYKSEGKFIGRQVVLDFLCNE